jgi:hypothetical protein
MAGEHWSVPQPVSEIVGDFNTASPYLSFDGKSLYFRSDQNRQNVSSRFYVATRPQAYGRFLTITELAALNDANGYSIQQPNGSYLIKSPSTPLGNVWVSRDNLRMYYTQLDTFRVGSGVVLTSRATISDPWLRSSKTVLGGISSTEWPPLYSASSYSRISLTEDELCIAVMPNSTIVKSRPGETTLVSELQQAFRDHLGVNFGTAAVIAGISSPAPEADPFIMADGLTLYFVSNKDYAGYKIYKATRLNRSEAFGCVELVDDLMVDGCDLRCPAVSADGNSIYFAVQYGGKSDIYYSEVIRQPEALAKHLIEHARMEKDNAGSALEQAMAFEREAMRNLEIARKNASGKYGRSLLKAKILVAISLVRDNIADQSIQKSFDELEEAMDF